MEEEYEEEQDYEQEEDEEQINPNLLQEPFQVPSKMSPQFKKFYETFSQHIEFIIKYEYNILPQQ